MRPDLTLSDVVAGISTGYNVAGIPRQTPEGATMNAVT